MRLGKAYRVGKVIPFAGLAAAVVWGFRACGLLTKLSRTNFSQFRTLTSVRVLLDSLAPQTRDAFLAGGRVCRQRCRAGSPMANRAHFGNWRGLRMLRSWFLGLWVVCLGLGEGVAASPDPGGSDLGAVWMKAARLPRRIRSVQFRMTAECSDWDAEGAAEKLKYEVKCYQQGGCFRVEATLTRASDQSRTKVVNLLSAYNGRHYQTFYPKSGVLALSSTARVPNAYFVLNPLVAPYVWLLSPGDQLSWSVVRDEQQWRKRLADARWAGRTSDGEHQFAVVEIPIKIALLKRPAICRVFFAEDLECFPLRWATSSDEGYAGSARVTAYAELQVDGEVAVVPLEIWTSDRLPDGSASEQHYVLDRDSLKLNEPIDAELFTISTARARVIRDLDKPPSHVTRPKGARRVAGGGTRRVLLGVIGAICSLALVVFFFWQGRTGRSQ